MWDPALYRQFGAERSRPFFELLGRIGATDPGFVADLGCGPGELTAELARRWTAADVIGVDSSAGDDRGGRGAVLADLRSAAATPRLRFEHADVGLRSGGPPGRSTSSCPTRCSSGSTGTRACCPGWSPASSPAAGSAFQMPGNFDQADPRRCCAS